VLLVLAACSDDGGSSGSGSRTTAAGTSAPVTTASFATDAPGNLLLNPGFEQGDQPWITLNENQGFKVTSERPHSGASSAHLVMRDPADASGAKVYYLVQEMTPSAVPNVVRGFYRVENWKKGSPHQYTQFVIQAWAPTNGASFGVSSTNYQLRYLLAGADSPPFAIGNAKFVFVTRQDPPLDQWVPFEVHPRDDFAQQWGTVPVGFSKLRLLFEVRFDNKVAGQSPSEADVYYDDLYAGPAG